MGIFCSDVLVRQWKPILKTFYITNNFELKNGAILYWSCFGKLEACVVILFMYLSSNIWNNIFTF